MDKRKDEASQGPVLLPVAGGKGGVGKSVVAANLAMALASMGFKTIAADLDLGGSNLYSFLGLPNTYRGVGDFIQADQRPLQEFLAPTAMRELKFLPGDGATPFMANITYHQKQRLLTAITSLPADFVLLDLGAGTSFNVLDFFGLSNRGLLVTTPEFPSILSLLGFLKNFLFRRLDEALKGKRELREQLNHLFHQPQDNAALTTTSILEQVRRLDPGAEQPLRDLCASIRPRVIFNLGEQPEDLNLVKQFQRGLKKVLSLEADYLGFIFTDSHVPRAVKQRKPLLTLFPDSIAAKEIKQIARRLLKFKDQAVANSAELLIESTRRFHERNVTLQQKE
jgi:flagellar biosynthesis protein FlhG